ncbi:hypothetical protein C8F04DRAFT_1298521 [Mycena alexandri]|uniref:Uncharacterized protein n=1 Tax=Mycena alexandri TaxID=1745969 RepID=A0AAD6WWG4_9AGAR|nr:hypothetical protein C8F04DRAFT_1298521 [Mycena alexandri]
MPTLVLDMLRLVCETAARANKRTALRLMLVSHLVESWIAPVLYETVQLSRQRTTNKFLRTLITSTTKSCTFFATCVKSLCILFNIPVDQLVKVTAVCHGIQNFTTWYIPAPRSGPGTAPLAHFLFSLRPKKLAAWHGVLHSPDPRFELPFFSQVTHLTVVNIWEEWVVWPNFSLPALTHLSLDFSFGSRVLAEEELQQICEAVEAILRECVNVQVCALRVDQPADAPTITSMLHRLQSMPRAVFYRHHEPFQIREAHSDVEAEIWETLEAAAKRHCKDGKRFVLALPRFGNMS